MYFKNLYNGCKYFVAAGTWGLERGRPRCSTSTQNGLKSVWWWSECQQQQQTGGGRWWLSVSTTNSRSKCQMVADSRAGQNEPSHMVPPFWVSSEEGQLASLIRLEKSNHIVLGHKNVFLRPARSLRMLLCDRAAPSLLWLKSCGFTSLAQIRFRCWHAVFGGRKVSGLSDGTELTSETQNFFLNPPSTESRSLFSSLPSVSCQELQAWRLA